VFHMTSEINLRVKTLYFINMSIEHAGHFAQQN